MREAKVLHAILIINRFLTSWLHETKEEDILRMIFSVEISYKV